MDPNQLKQIHSDNLKVTQDEANDLSIGMFLLKTHEETFNNLDMMAHDMATNIVKRFMMLSAESDGIELILKVGGANLFKDTGYKLFITKMVQYFKKIKEDPEYKTLDEYKYNEELVYDKFNALFENIKSEAK